MPTIAPQRYQDMTQVLLQSSWETWRLVGFLGQKVTTGRVPENLTTDTETGHSTSLNLVGKCEWDDYCWQAPVCLCNTTTSVLMANCNTRGLDASACPTSTAHTVTVLSLAMLAYKQGTQHS